MSRARWIVNTVCGVGMFALAGLLLVETLLLDPARRAEQATVRRTLTEGVGILIVASVDRGDFEGLRSGLAKWIERHHAAGARSVVLTRTDGTQVFSVAHGPVPVDAETDGDAASSRIDLPILRGEEVWGRAVIRFDPMERGLLARLDLNGHRHLLLALLVIGPIGLAALEWRRRRRGETRGLSATSAEHRARQTLNTLAEGAVVMDTELRIVFANEAFARFCGCNPDRLHGRAIDAEGWQPADAEPGDLPWRRALATAQAVRGVRLRHKLDGTVRTYIVNALPIAGSDSAVRGFMATFDDVTELEQQRVELAVARDAAEHASRVKSTFLANMSHEIRTPLNGVIGTLDLLTDTQMTGTQPKLIDAARVSADTLMSLINDVLDLSKIEAGQLELYAEDFDLRRTIEQAFTVLQPKAASKSLGFTWSIDPRIEPHVHGDSDRLRQVLINLLGNAVKFTDTGEVRLDARLDHRDGDVQTVRIEIRDTGIGIAADKRDRLFQPFTQADASTSRRFGGTGLGLAISRQIVQILGGRIDVDSELGEGTTFTISLPLPAAVNAADPAHRDDASRSRSQPQRLRHGLRVLVVEDNPINQFVTTQILQNAGARTEVVGSGQLAIERLATDPFDVVLMDCFLPDMDGYETTRRIRRCEAERGDAQRIPIIALTAKAMSGDREICLAAGMDDYVTKPVDKSRLLRAIQNLTGGHGAPTDPANHECGSSVPELPDAGPCADAAAATTTEAFRREDLLNICMGDPDVACRLLDLFEQTCCSAMTELESAMKSDDLEAVERLAHRLKGGAGHAGAARLVDAAALAERCAATGELDELAALAARLRAELASCMQSLPALRGSLTRQLNSQFTSAPTVGP